MTLTIAALAGYLGNPASRMLADSPFKNWAYVRSFEDDLDEPLIDYVFPANGLDFVCDGADNVASIFLYSDGSRSFESPRDLRRLFGVSHASMACSRVC